MLLSPASLFQSLHREVNLKDYAVRAIAEGAMDFDLTQDWWPYLAVEYFFSSSRLSSGDQKNLRLPV